uniref:EF-hand domain-containing protein n=1 Tax=Macrostomum lignano TaxID=282301 RepID=A0A1I8IKQ9_9PLAT
VDSAGLLYFLVSNLLTGLFNLIISRLVPNRESLDGAPCFVIVLGYTMTIEMTNPAVDLHKAAMDPENGPKHFIDAVSSLGTAVLLKANSNGATPLQLSAMTFSRKDWKASGVHIVRASNLSTRDFYDNTAAHYAARNRTNDDVILEVVAMTNSLACLTHANDRTLGKEKGSILEDAVKLLGNKCLAWKNKSQQTVLHYAMYNCNPDTGKVLIEAVDNAVIEMKDSNGDMCLHVVARSNKDRQSTDAVLKAAIQKQNDGAIVFRLNERWQSPFRLALDVFGSNVPKQAPTREKYQLDTFKNTMLHYLFKCYRTEVKADDLSKKVTDFFLKFDEIRKHVDLKAENKLGQNCLHAAELHPTMLREVLHEAAKTHSYKEHFVKLLYSSNSLHVVHTFASRYDLKQIIQPLAELSDKKDAELLKLTVPKGSNKNATCLHFACEGGQTANIRYLLSNGLRLQKFTEAGMSCIDFAIDRGTLETTEKAVKNFYEELSKKQTETSENNGAQDSDALLTAVESPDAEILLLIDPARRSIKLPDRRTAQRLLTSVADHNKDFSAPQPKSETLWRRKRDSEILFKIIELDSVKILRSALRIDIITSNIGAAMFEYLIEKIQEPSAAKHFPRQQKFCSRERFDLSSELLIIDMAAFFKKDEILPDLVLTRQFELIPASISLLVELGPKILKMRAKARGKHAKLQQLHEKILSIAVNALDELFASADADERKLLFDYIQGRIADEKGVKGPLFPFRNEKGVVKQGTIIAMIEMANCNELFATDCIFNLAQKNFEQGREPSCCGEESQQQQPQHQNSNPSGPEASNSRSFLYRSFSPLSKFWLHCASFGAFTLFFTWYVIDFKRSFESGWYSDIVIVLFTISFTMQEIIDMRRRKKIRTYLIGEAHICRCPNYCEEVLNFFDCTVILAMIVGLAWKWALLALHRPLQEAYPSQMVFTIAFGLLMFRWVHFLSYSGVIGPIVSMLWSLLFNDLAPFMAIISVFIYAFGVFFFNLLFPVTSTDTTSKKYNSSWYGWDAFTQVMTLPFNILFTNFDKIDFNPPSLTNVTIGKTAHVQGIGVFENLMLFLFMGLVNIVMLNLLIALFNLRVSRMANEALGIWRKTYFSMLREYESLSPVPPPLSCLYYIYKMLSDCFCCQTKISPHGAEDENNNKKWWLTPKNYPERYLRFLRFQAMQFRRIRPKLLTDPDWSRKELKSLEEGLDNKLADIACSGDGSSRRPPLKRHDAQDDIRPERNLTAQSSREDLSGRPQVQRQQSDTNATLEKIISMESSIKGIQDQIKGITELLEKKQKKRRRRQKTQTTEHSDAAVGNRDILNVAPALLLKKYVFTHQFSLQFSLQSVSLDLANGQEVAEHVRHSNPAAKGVAAEVGHRERFRQVHSVALDAVHLQREFSESVSAAVLPVVDGDAIDKRWSGELPLPPFGRVVVWLQDKFKSQGRRSWYSFWEEYCLPIISRDDGRYRETLMCRMPLLVKKLLISWLHEIRCPVLAATLNEHYRDSGLGLLPQRPEDWKTGRLEDRKTGRPEDWKTGRLEDRKTGRPKDWKTGRLEDRKTGRSEDRKTGRMEDWMTNFVLFFLRLSAFGIVSMLVLIVAVAAASQSRPAYYLASQSQPANPAESSLDDGTAAVAACRFAVDARVCRLDAASLEALRRLHAALDDDKDGSVDAAELDGFAREELSQVHSFERVYSGSDAAGRSPADTAAAAAFGSRKGGGGKGNALDLWRAWRASEMHNWTVEEVCSWLSAHASLGQLVPLARELGIDGPHLPLLTELSPHPSVAPLAQALSPTEKRKLTIRATDLVLFGPPGNRQRRRVFAELDSLHHAERSLGDLQEKLSRSEQQRELDRAERLRLQDIYQKEIDSLKAEAGRLSSQRLNTTETDLAEKLRLAEQEVCQLRAALETESQRRPAAAAVSPELWTLLQLTWESELRYCRQNWQQAELRLAKASEGLERLRRKQNSAIGVLRGAFNSAEMVGTFEMSIAEAK